MGYEFTETLYLDETREEVVKEGDPRARFLLGVPGQVLPDEEAARLGLGKSKRQERAPDAAEPEAAPKATHARDAEDKAQHLGQGGAQDKGR